MLVTLATYMTLSVSLSTKTITLQLETWVCLEVAIILTVFYLPINKCAFLPLFSALHLSLTSELLEIQNAFRVS